VVEEAGYSMDGQHAKGVETYLGKLPVDYLFIVCDRAAKSCPTVWPGSPTMERIVEIFEDPAAFEGSPEETLAKFREVRDRIEARIRDWLAGLDR
jgi:arsenate reductase